MMMDNNNNNNNTIELHTAARLQLAVGRRGLGPGELLLCGGNFAHTFVGKK